MASGTGDVVVLIPGITGSVLEHDGREVWAPAAGAAVRAFFSLGRSIRRLRLDGDDPDADDLGDGVVATRVQPDLHILPGLDWKIDGYGRFREQVVGRFGCVPVHPAGGRQKSTDFFRAPVGSASRRSWER